MEEKTSSFKSVKKPRGRFNVVDLLVVLVIIGLAAVFAVSALLMREAEGESVRIEYTVLIENVDKAFYDSVKVGDRVWEASSGTALGYVSKIDNSERAYVFEYDQNKSMVKLEYPDKYNLKITVSSDAKYIEDADYKIEDHRIAVGRNMDLRFVNLKASGYCIDFNRVR